MPYRNDVGKQWLVLLCTVLLLQCCEASMPSGEAVAETRTGNLSSGKETSPAVRSGPLRERGKGGAMSLEKAIYNRRSIRSFEARPLTDDELRKLAFAAQGVTSEQGLRAAPSAGATYPLELHIVTARGVYRYNPNTDTLGVLAHDNRMTALAAAALGQRFVAETGATFVFGATVSRTGARYGDRAERYVYIETGCAAENLMLTATAMGLGSVMVGAHDDGAVKRIAKLPTESEVVVMVSVGVPKQ